MTGVCDVCSREAEIHVCASTMGAISLGYCSECLNNGLEPYNIMVSYIACAGSFPEGINEEYQRHIRHILNTLGVSEEQFINDVNKTIDEIYEGMNRIEKEFADSGELDDFR